MIKFISVANRLEIKFETKEKLRKNGNFYSKFTMVFGVTLKQMTVDTCN